MLPAVSGNRKIICTCRGSKHCTSVFHSVGYSSFRLKLFYFMREFNCKTQCFVTKSLAQQLSWEIVYQP